MVFCLFLLFGPFSAFFPQFLFKGFQELKLPDWEWGPPPDPNGEVSVTFHEGHPLMQCDSQFSIYIRGRPPFPILRPASDLGTGNWDLHLGQVTVPQVTVPQVDL